MSYAKSSPEGSKLLFLVKEMKGYYFYMTRITFLTFSFSIIAAKFSQDSMFTLKNQFFPFIKKLCTVNCRYNTVYIV